MLTESSVSIGTNLAEIITDANIKLVPKSSTLLQELASSVSNNIFTHIDNKDFIEPTILHASLGSEINNKNIKSYNPSSHDVLMDNYIEDLSKIVSNHVSFSRNVVNKEITILKEKLQECLSSYKYREAEDFFNVSYFKLHEVFKSYIIDSEIHSYRNSSGKFFFDSMNISKISREDFDLLAYILTGDEEQDAYITSWFNTLGKNKALSYILDNIPDYSLSVVDLLDYSLINYLFYRNLLNKNDLDLGYTSIQLRAKSSSNKDYFGNKLATSIDLYFKDIRNNRLLATNSELGFSYFNNNPLNITIYEENFAKLADAGCNIEVLFGYIVSEPKIDVTVDQLVSNKENYLSKWNNIKSLYLISMNNSRLDIFKQILRTKFEESVNGELTDAEKEISANTVDFINETKRLGNEYIDELQLSEIENIDRICLDLVAKIRFRFTNSYFILNDMYEILSMSDDIEPLEAALMSSVKYVTDFLLEQADIVRQ